MASKLTLKSNFCSSNVDRLKVEIIIFALVSILLENPVELKS